MNEWRLDADTSGTRRSRIRPIPHPSSSAATTTIALFCVSRPWTPSSLPPRYLHTALELLPAGSDHCTAQLMEPTPSRLIASETEHALKPQCASSRFLTCQVPHRLKPHPQRFSRAVKNGAGSHGGLTLAFRAPQMIPGRYPSAGPTTIGAFKAFAPPNPVQKSDTSRLGQKPLIEFLQCSRVVNTTDGMSGRACHKSS